MIRINMRFASALEELEKAENLAIPPRLQTGATEILPCHEFANRCNRENLLRVGKWEGFCVYAKVDFIWPPVSWPKPYYRSSFRKRSKA
jgi:hypothetical protein